MKPEKPARILAVDFAIIDLIYQIPTSGDSQIETLVSEQGLKWGGKARISEGSFKDIYSPAFEGKPLAAIPGGSSFNTLWNIGMLLGDSVDLAFIGAVGEGTYGSMIRGAMKEAGIRIIPSVDEFRSMGKADPLTTVSFVIVPKDGSRTIATYPGNARELITADMITEDLIRNSDIIFLQGSAWQKFDRSVADRMMELRWKEDKELWLALPTTAWNLPHTEKETFKWLLTSANVVVSNGEELAGIYGLNPDTGAQQALEALQQEFKHNHNERIQKKGQVAFITLGEKGAAVVTADSIVNIPPSPPEKIVSTLGAGDTSYAGFFTGLIAGLNPADSARLAMGLAGENLKHNGPRIPDPLAAITMAMPWLSAELSSTTSLAGAVAR